MRRAFTGLALLISAFAACRAAPADTYKQSLIRRCPQYKAAAGRFAPVYPALARQIVKDYGITKGVCVDVGGGSGPLAFALARTTRLTVYMLDIDPVAVRLCSLLADEARLTGRVCAIEGDAQQMPFRDGFADLVVSRGSIFFWPNQLAGVKEAYRILKPRGVAYIGGGFSRVLDAKTHQRLAQRRRQAAGRMKRGGWKPLDKDLVERAKAAGITRIRLLREPDDVGWWLEVRK